MDEKEQELYRTIAQLHAPDAQIEKEVRQCWDRKAKPLGGMGQLEGMVAQLGAILGTAHPQVRKRCVVVMAADNGVAAEGVSQTDHQVTSKVTANMVHGKASVSILARLNHADVFPVDIGMQDDLEEPGIWNRKIRSGTFDMAKGPAMSRQEVVRAIWTGIEVIEELAKEGYDLFATGEMGIGNTTTSSAVASVLLNLPVEEVTGRGAGLSDEGFSRKKAVIRQAIDLNQPNKDDILDVLAKIGGLDLAGLTGCFIGAAYVQKPILLDGFISSVAALAATLLAPVSRDYMFPSHVSAEPGGKRVLEALHMEACIHAGMCLGEGTGAVTAFHLFDTALAIYDQLPEFEETGIEAYQHYEKTGDGRLHG